VKKIRFLLSLSLGLFAFSVQAQDKANIDLSNLSGTAVNAAIVPDTNAARDLGSYTKRFRQIISSHLRVGDITEGSSAPGIGSALAVQTTSDWPLWIRVDCSAANCEALTRLQHFSGSYLPQPIFAGMAARGSMASPSALQANDILLALDGRGYDGSGNNYGEYAVGFSDTSAQISLRANQSWVNGHGSYIAFKTTPNNSITPAEVMRIGSNGNVGFGDFTGGDPGTKLTVISGSPGDGIYVQNVGNPGASIYLDANNSVNGNRTASTIYLNNSSMQWATGIRSGDGNFHIYDVGHSADRVIVTSAGDLSIKNNGLILKATDGANCFRVTVNNSGALATTSVTCP
jgi:hypothetical protein